VQPIIGKVGQATGLAAEVGLVEKDYFCEDCHFTWPKEGIRPSHKRPHGPPYYFIQGVAQAPAKVPQTPAQSQSKAA
jgi:hypothetical protein